MSFGKANGILLLVFCLNRYLFLTQCNVCVARTGLDLLWVDIMRIYRCLDDMMQVKTFFCRFCI